jgi:hypothetical protein
MLVFSGSYTEETLIEDLLDDIFIVFSDMEDTEGHPKGTRPGKYIITIEREDG